MVNMLISLFTIHTINFILFFIFAHFLSFTLSLSSSFFRSLPQKIIFKENKESIEVCMKKMSK
jgi:hypothetical protein